MLPATTVVTVYAFPLLPLLVGLVAAWIALLAGILVEVRDGRNGPPGPRTSVLVALGATLAVVSAFLGYGVYALLRA